MESSSFGQKLQGSNKVRSRDTGGDLGGSGGESSDAETSLEAGRCTTLSATKMEALWSLEAAMEGATVERELTSLEAARSIAFSAIKWRHRGGVVGGSK